MRGAARIDQDQFAVENGRLRGELAEGLDQARQPFRVFGAVARIGRSSRPSLMIWKRNPSHLGSRIHIVAFWWADGCRRQQGTDERETNGHVPYVGLKRSGVTPGSQLHLRFARLDRASQASSTNFLMSSALVKTGRSAARTIVPDPSGASVPHIPTPVRQLPD